MRVYDPFDTKGLIIKFDIIIFVGYVTYTHDLLVLVSNFRRYLSLPPQSLF